MYITRHGPQNVKKNYIEIFTTTDCFHSEVFLKELVHKYEAPGRSGD